jgi:CubicO group peptidase (beta-lactamase class C family)
MGANRAGKGRESMNAVRVSVLAIVSFIFVALPATSQPLPTARPDRVGLSPERLERVTGYFKNEIAEKRLPGAVMLVARRGRIAYFEALGTQDPATGAPMTKDSIFRIWSMTKPFVSVATMMLVEEGKLTLGDPVSRYLPEFAKLEVSVEKLDPETRKATYSNVPAKRQITVHDLMRHTSGIPYGFLTSNAQIREAHQKAGLEPAEITSAEFATRVAKMPLVHQPGAAFEYGYSTDILGRVVEVASGMRLSEILEKRIFVPLGMRDTGFHVADASKDRLAQPFDMVPGTKTPMVKLFDPRLKPAMDGGGGRGVGTAGDYVRFCQMLLNGGQLDGVRLVSRTTVRFMTSDHLGTATAAGMGPGDLTFGTPGYTYGLGFGVRREAGGASVPGSPGEYMWTGTYNTLFFVDPQEELIGIFLSVGAGSAIRLDHRVKFKQLVYQAIVD